MSASMSFYVDGQTWLHLCQYGERRSPILTLNADGHSLTLAAQSDVPISDQLDFARSLADNAAAFLAAMELFAATADTAA